MVASIGFLLTGLAALLAVAAGVLVLRLRPGDYIEEFDGGALPRLVRAQRCPMTLASTSANLSLVDTILLAASR